MPEPHDQPVPAGPAIAATPLDQRLRELPGLAPLVAEAERIWRRRAVEAGQDPDDPDARPGWRTFEDSFPTFYEFTNRPR
jgi:hypothetical protein